MVAIATPPFQRSLISTARLDIKPTGRCKYESDARSLHGCTPIGAWEEAVWFERRVRGHLEPPPPPVIISLVHTTKQRCGVP